MQLFIVMVLFAGIAYTFAVLTSNRTLKGIWDLSAAMQTLESGDTEIQLDNSASDEIGQLILSFNHMAKRIHQLMNEKIKYGLHIKDLELKALQAQINPHFLYNTLDIINCLAIQNHIPKISEVIDALASFYKISLNKGRSHISIRGEIKHAQMYVKIQNIRFDNQIQVFWDISPEIEGLTMINLILQPIIENAAIHGIYERENSSGTIRVKGWLEHDIVLITVSDDGIGMTEDIIANNFLTTTPAAVVNEAHGYGIRNINERLKIAYGQEYGLFCESIPNIGTTVTIRFPKQR